MPGECRPDARSGPSAAGWPTARLGSVRPSSAVGPAAGWTPATAGDPGGDAAAAQHLPAAREVVAFVSVQLGRSPAWPAWSSPRPDDCWNGVDQLLEELGVVGVGRRQADRQRDAAGVDHQVVLGAGLAAVDRIRASQFPPRRARTLTLSIEARDQLT